MLRCVNFQHPLDRRDLLRGHGVPLGPGNEECRFAQASAGGGLVVAVLHHVGRVEQRAHRLEQRLRRP